MNQKIRPFSKLEECSLHSVHCKFPLQSVRDPRAKLTTALDILDGYHEINSASRLLSGLQKQKTGQGMKGIVRYALKWIASHFSSQSRRRQATLEKKVQYAIDEVQRYHPVVSSTSSKESQKLMERALSAIQRHNQLIHAAKSTPSTWKKRLLRFFINKSSPSLRTKNPIVLHEIGHSKRLQSVSAISQALGYDQTPISLSRREEDAFRMKAISMIKKHGIAFSSIEEALKAIQQSPIISQRELSSVISLEQTVHPFPGEVVILKGAFKRHSGLPIASMPIPERFELSLESSQTGFPCPSLHTGWSLGDELIPPKIHSPESLKALFDLLQKKKKAAQELKESTEVRRSTYEIFQLKKRAAEHQIKPFLTLHKCLCMAFLAAAPSHLVGPEAANHISQFFIWLESSALEHTHLEHSHRSPYLELSSAYQKLNRACFSLPFESLNQAWILQADPRLLSTDRKISLKTAEQLLKNGWEKSLEEIGNNRNYGEQQERKTKDSKEVKRAFQRALAPVFAIPAREIFLQYFSETIDFSPPPLSTFAKKLQSLALIQQEEFLLVLNKEKKEKKPEKSENRKLGSELDKLSQHLSFSIEFDKIKKQLSSAIEHLNRSSPIYHPLVESLEKYYTERVT